MDSVLRDLALRTIPVLDESKGSKELYLYIGKAFSMMVASSPGAKEELGIILLSKLRGTYAVLAVQQKCKTYEDISSKVVR